MREAAALAATLVALAACRPSPGAAPAAPDPATLPAPDVRVEQSLHLQAGKRELLGRAVVVKQGDRLDLLLLAPTGQRLLTVRDRGGVVTADARAGGLDRLDPALLLDDVRWAFLDGCPPQAADLRQRRCTRDGRAVHETDDPRTGDLARREVSRGNSIVVLEFGPWSGVGRDRRPGRVTLRDDARGYSWEAGVEAWEPLAPGR
jgi:hypothetical protein